MELTINSTPTPQLNSACGGCLVDEPERARFDRLIEQAGVRMISTATLLEGTLVVEGREGVAAAV